MTTEAAAKAGPRDAGSARRHGRPKAQSGERLEQIVGFCGALPQAAEHIQERFGLGRSETYRHLGIAIEAGLLERVAPLRAEPALIRATREGMRYAGLGLDVARISPALVRHWIWCSEIAIGLEHDFGRGSVISAAELRFAESLSGRPIASASLGERVSGLPHLHRPDLVIFGGDRPIAVEVELTPKAPERLYRIVRAWRRASCVSEVRYFCAPGLTRRAVERAIQRSHAHERVRIFDPKEGR